MHVRTSIGLGFIILVSTAWPAACAPDSSLPSGTQGVSSGAGGEDGGVLFDTGPGCSDPSDGDGDLIADTLERVGAADTDDDGTLDETDLDSDADGILDADEATNPLLDPTAAGQTRDDPCDGLADSDSDGTPDAYDTDSDNDGISDAQEATYDVDGSSHCRVLIDCDGDGVIDIIEIAAGSDPESPDSIPVDPALYFVLPYGAGEQTKDFPFSTGVSRADVYFLVDTTNTMQPTIDALTSSLDSQIIPGILNGDLGATPPIPPIDEAWIGVGAVRDVPWPPYGQAGDDIYQHRFIVNGMPVVGDVAAPVANGPTWSAPANVSAILGSLTAAGGGDGPEGTSQALWIAAANQPYAATTGGLWSPAPPYPAQCAAGMLGVPCFRPDSLPVFVIITDAPLHNGPQAINGYNPQVAGGTKSYTQVTDALAAIHAKVVGVPVAGSNPGAARADLTDLALKTGSLYHDPAFGGVDVPLVPEVDVASGAVSDEVVRLLGQLAGAGLHDVTTSRASYDCAGGVDCTGDGAPDLEYHNPTIAPDPGPFDASKLITAVRPVESQESPLPYASLDDTTFFDVRGSAEVTFRVHARNDIVKPTSLVVMRAVIRVQTPAGQVLGGKNGLRLVYFVIPEYLPVAE
jgi:hypothetical protein